MRIAGIVLFVLQAISIFGGFAEDSARGNSLGTNLKELFTITNVSSFLQLLGYFLPTIIGIILLIKAHKKNKA